MNETGKTEKQGKTLFQWMIPRWRMVKLCGVLLCFAFITVQIGSYVWFTQYVQRGFGGRSYEQIQELWQTPVCFPVEWDTSPETKGLFDDDVKRLSAILDDTLKKAPQVLTLIDALVEGLSSMAFLQKKPPWDDLPFHITPLSEFYQEGLELSKSAGAEIQSGSNSDFLPRLYSDHQYIPSHLRNLIRLKALLKDAEGLYSEAIDTHLTALPLYVTSTADHQHDLRALKKIIPEIESLASNVNDKKHLQSWLDTLTEWRPVLFRIQQEQRYLYPLFQELKSCNSPIQYGQSVRVIEYIRQLAEKKFPPLPRWDIFVHLSVTGFKPVNNLKNNSRLPLIELFRPFDFTGSIEDYYACRALNYYYFFYCYDNQLQTRAEYDRLRLFIAAKLYALDTGRPPSTSADLVPAYISEEIMDPETNEPYRWDEKGQMIISETFFP